MRTPVEGPLAVRQQRCGFGGNIEIPAHIIKSGSPETDVIIFVTSRPIARNSEAVAFAGHCQEDEGRERSHRISGGRGA